MNLVEVLKIIGSNTGYFLVGFIAGTIVDLIFALIYKKLDPDRKYNKRLILLVVLHLIVLVAVLSGLIELKHRQTGNGTVHTFMMHFGFVSSQFYLFDYIEKYIGSLLMRHPDKFPTRPVRDIDVLRTTYEIGENA